MRSKLRFFITLVFAAGLGGVVALWDFEKLHPRMDASVTTNPSTLADSGYTYGAEVDLIQLVGAPNGGSAFRRNPNLRANAFREFQESEDPNLPKTEPGEPHFPKALLRMPRIAGGTGFSNGSETNDIPLQLQAALFKKILELDRTVSSRLRRSELKMLVIAADETTAAVELSEAFEKIGIKSQIVRLGDPIPNADAAYVFPRAASTELERALEGKHLISLGSVLSMAQTGQVALAIETREERLNIFVNHTATKRAEHDLSSELLRLATVVN